MGFANFWENEILDHVMGKGSYTPPTVYVGLSTADPLDDASGLAEPSGNGYARITTAAANWNVAASGIVDNGVELAFPAATGSWGTVTHVGLFDAATAGNLMASGALTVPKAISSGDTPKFAAGDLDVTLD
jgi:hypothetical protein